jgi:hypothetical protein
MVMTALKIEFRKTNVLMGSHQPFCTYIYPRIYHRLYNGLFYFSMTVILTVLSTKILLYSTPINI